MFGFTLLSAIGGGHAPSTGDGRILREQDLHINERDGHLSGEPL